MDKQERYNWNKLGPQTKQKWVDISCLHLHPDYQRMEHTDRLVLRIAHNFSWDEFGCLTVTPDESQEGHYWILDGGTRWTAAKRRSDIQRVPVLVTTPKTKADQSLCFWGINTHRTPVSAYHKYRARVVAQQQPELEIEQHLREVGLGVGRGAEKLNVVDFPAGLVRTWVWNKSHTKTALALQRSIIGDSPMNGDIHNGLYWLASHGIDVAPHVLKLAQMGGRTAILRAIKAFRIETGKTAIPQSGLAILRLINHRKAHKIKPTGDWD